MYPLCKRAVVLCAAAVLVSVAPFAHSQEAQESQNDAAQTGQSEQSDMAALKANFEAEFASLNTKDLTGTLAQAHEDIVLFGIFSPFPSNGKKEFEQAAKSYFGTYEKADFTPVSPQFRIVGTTAVSWGHYQLAAAPKGGEQLSYSHGRYIFTHVKVDGKWLILSMHISPLEPYRAPPF